MNRLYIKPDTDTPEIVLDKEKSEFIFKGKSLPEDARQFYAPVFNWLEEYLENPNDHSVFVFMLDYLNTASTKIITELIYKISAIKEKGKSLKVNWYYETYDHDMKKLGADISFFTGVTFEFLIFEEEE